MVDKIGIISKQKLVAIVMFEFCGGILSSVCFYLASAGLEPLFVLLDVCRV